jgi:hypothetical protein
LATRMAMMMVGVKMTEDESVESSDEEVSHWYLLPQRDFFYLVQLEVSDTPATKAHPHHLTDKRLQIICHSCDMNPVLPEEFIDMINDGDSGSWQQCEDHAFGRLYRGYEMCLWGASIFEPKKKKHEFISSRLMH